VTQRPSPSAAASATFGAIFSASVLPAGATSAKRCRAGPGACWRAVEIVRDDWGIAHITGKTDADAVFGMIYAQAEDDFNRVETNYLNSMGRLAEAEGEDKVWQDLRMKLFIDPAGLKKQYAASPAWLKKLMDAWAAGLNFYLAKHPDVKPRVIQHFEPWMALSFTEGSIGGDIERVDLKKLAAFYERDPAVGDAHARTLPPAPASTIAPPPAAASDADQPEPEPGGSNGIAIAPANTSGGHALLLINPHTSFYFRSELQMVSERRPQRLWRGHLGTVLRLPGIQRPRRLDAHLVAAAMPSTSIAETIVRRIDGPYYQYGSTLRKLKRQIISSLRSNRAMRSGDAGPSPSITAITVPIVRAEGGKWIAVRLLADTRCRRCSSPTCAPRRTTTASSSRPRSCAPIPRTTRSTRTGTARSRISTATSSRGAIPAVRLHHPVDGSNPATEWHGAACELHELISILNPKSGWLQNTNNWPFSAAGADSPLREDYPRYMWRTARIRAACTRWRSCTTSTASRSTA
jgi:acyl-homoserine-lactone acylase